MYKRILLAYDGSEEGRRALLECANLAQELEAEVQLLAVMPPYANMMMIEGLAVEDVLEHEKTRFKAVLDEGVRRLTERGFTNVEGVLASGEPVDEICTRARDIKAELVCVGHRRATTWAQRWWRGSVGANLIDHAPCSVLIAMPI
ncbi:MAG TPA: universal stress protein [Burkholderiales bacterium]|jgi:nucleotide-binding universal stress UspA family protein